MDINQNNNKIINRKMKVKASEIIQIFNSIQEQQAFCKENIKHYLYFIDSFFPKEQGLDSKYFLHFLRGDQKVIFFIIFHSCYRLIWQGIIV